jgi:SulP family sulfate permease
MIALLQSYRLGLLSVSTWKNNFIAGLIVGIVALPLAMAFAIASGIKPEQGIYTAIIAGLIVAIFGGTRVQVSGPTGAFVVILAGITAHYGVSGLLTATIIAGVILTLMGILGLGNAIQFIPYPVIVGFTSGIGVIIFVGQWKDFFGLTVKVPLDAHFYTKVAMLGNSLGLLDLSTALVGLGSLATIIFVPKIFKRIPGPLVAMIGATLVVEVLHLTSVATIGSVFGAIPSTMPTFALPDFSLTTLRHLIGPACTIALLGAIESLLSATVADSMIGDRHDANQELIGQGLANIAAPFWGGFASTGAIARTATNIRSGGTNPLAAIIHALFLVGVIVLLAPYAAHIPLCALAAILFVVAYNMSDIPEFIHIIRRAPWFDSFILLITFLLTIFTDLVVAVAVGVMLAMLFFMRRMYQSVSIGRSTKFSDSTPLPDGCIAYTIDGPFFFGVTEKIEYILTHTKDTPRIIIFRLDNMPFIDMTGLERFGTIIDRYLKKGVKVYLCEAHTNVTHKLNRTGILEKITGKKIFITLHDAVAHINNQQK